ncbi:MAG: hypothetical protein Q9170_001054 [Blastenia crenularia]
MESRRPERATFLVVWKTREGVLQLVTAPLMGGFTLHGVTRKSVLDLARTRLNGRVSGSDSVEVVEKKFSMDELGAAVEEGRLVEAFVAGTAYFIRLVSHIHYRGKDLGVPTSKACEDLYASTVRSWLRDIMNWEESHEWSIVVQE